MDHLLKASKAYIISLTSIRKSVKVLCYWKTEMYDLKSIKYILSTRKEKSQLIECAAADCNSQVIHLNLDSLGSSYSQIIYVFKIQVREIVSVLMWEQMFFFKLFILLERYFNLPVYIFNLPHAIIFWDWLSENEQNGSIIVSKTTMKKTL